MGFARANPSYRARYARACRGHPRLTFAGAKKTWMAGTSPAMTKRRGAGRGPYNSKSQCSLTTGRPQLLCRSVRISLKPAFS